MFWRSGGECSEQLYEAARGKRDDRQEERACAWVRWRDGRKQQRGYLTKGRCCLRGKLIKNEKKEIVNVEVKGGGGEHRILAPSLPVQALIIIDSFSGFSICHSVNEKKNSLLPRWQLRLLRRTSLLINSGIWCYTWRTDGRVMGRWSRVLAFCKSQIQKYSQLPREYSALH